MTNEQRWLVERSWWTLIGDHDRFAERFYTRLFERDPSLRPLFDDDMAAQQKMFARMLGILIQDVHEQVGLQEKLASLGQRHVGYGVQDEHYDAAGAALLDALHDTLGDRLTASNRDAWATLFEHVADGMKRGARRASMDASSAR